MDDFESVEHVRQYHPGFIEAATQLFYWQYANEDPEKATNFSGMIFTLISKAQSTPSNMSKLIKGFPYEVSAYFEWAEAGNCGKDFFAKYELFPSKREGEFREGLAETYTKKAILTETDHFNRWAETQKSQS